MPNNSDTQSWQIDKYLTKRGYEKYNIPKHLCILTNGKYSYLLYDTFRQIPLWECQSEHQTEVKLQMYGFYVRTERDNNFSTFESLSEDIKNWKPFKYEKNKEAKETIR